MWWAPCEEIDADLDVLDDEERAVAARRGGDRDRRRYVQAHVFLRTVLAGVVGGEPAGIAFRRQCAGCGRTGHGKPRLAGSGGGVGFSLSHGGRFVMVAVGPDPVGADVEDPDAPAFSDEGMTRAFTGDECQWLGSVAPNLRRWAALQLWTRKEALGKAAGLGLRTDPLQVDALAAAAGVTATVGSTGHLERAPRATVRTVSTWPMGAVAAAVGVPVSPARRFAPDGGAPASRLAGGASTLHDKMEASAIRSGETDQ